MAGTFLAEAKEKRSNENPQRKYFDVLCPAFSEKRLLLRCFPRERQQPLMELIPVNDIVPVP
jgi:hypothetical protein